MMEKRRSRHKREFFILFVYHVAFFMLYMLCLLEASCEFCDMYVKKSKFIF
jgi:hypothetical protein